MYMAKISAFTDYFYEDMMNKCPSQVDPYLRLQVHFKDEAPEPNDCYFLVGIYNNRKSE